MARVLERTWLPLVLCTFVGMILTADCGARAEDGKLSIAVIDMQMILRDSRASKSVRPQMEKLRSSYRSAVRKEEETLREESERLRERGEVLSPDAYAKERRQYEIKARAAQTEFRARKQRIDQAYSAAIEKIQKTMIIEAAKIANERSLDLVLPKSIIILSAKDLDITSEVLEHLDRALPSVDVVLPEALPPDGATSGN